VIKPWPFKGWAMDLIRDIIPHSSKNYAYILVYKIGGSHTFKERNPDPGDKIYQTEYCGKVWNSRVHHYG